jgi:hypothetical protein
MYRIFLWVFLLLSSCASGGDTTHRVFADYRKSLSDLAQEVSVNQSFEVTLGDLSLVSQKAESSAEVEVLLIILGRKLSFNEAIADLRSKKLRPANLTEFFALAVKMSTFPASDLMVVELGTLLEAPNGQKSVATLSIRDGYRYITTLSVDRTFHERTIFAAVRK